MMSGDLWKEDFDIIDSGFFFVVNYSDISCEFVTKKVFLQNKKWILLVKILKKSCNYPTAEVTQINQ